jgi:hypothetical protein
LHGLDDALTPGSPSHRAPDLAGLFALLPVIPSFTISLEAAAAAADPARDCGATPADGFDPRPPAPPGRRALGLIQAALGQQTGRPALAALGNTRTRPDHPSRHFATNIVLDEMRKGSWRASVTACGWGPRTTRRRAMAFPASSTRSGRRPAVASVAATIEPVAAPRVTRASAGMSDQEPT